MCLVLQSISKGKCDHNLKYKKKKKHVPVFGNEDLKCRTAFLQVRKRAIQFLNGYRILISHQAGFANGQQASRKVCGGVRHKWNANQKHKGRDITPSRAHTLARKPQTTVLL